MAADAGAGMWASMGWRLQVLTRFHRSQLGSSSCDCMPAIKPASALTLPLGAPSQAHFLRWAGHPNPSGFTLEAAYKAPFFQRAKVCASFG